MLELEKHYLEITSLHTYKCSCGYVAYLFPNGAGDIAKRPKKTVTYLPCGHAACAKTKGFDCIICTMQGR